MGFVHANMETEEPENTKESLKDSESLKPEKKGGPYSKKEQEERKIKVYHLHFEENKSAVEIAELLNVNRNTINDDIKYWHQQLVIEFKVQDLPAKMTKQIHRIEIQRDRLLVDLDDAEKFDEKIKLEKFVSDIDNRLVQLFSKLISSGKTILAPTVNLEEINEDEIKKFVRDLILEDTDPNSEDVYSENHLKYCFILKTKCDVEHSEKVVEKMKRDGLVLCEQSRISSDHSTAYDLAKFAGLLGYVTIDEQSSIIKERKKIILEMDREEKERVEKFIKKHGSQSKWSEEVWQEYIGEED